jgi:hypothetical protein
MKYLYLCVSGDWLKFGIARNIENRIRAYGTHNPNFTIPIIWFGFYETIQDYEKLCLERLGKFERNKDWAKVGISEIKEIIEFVDDYLGRCNSEKEMKIICCTANERLERARLKRIAEQSTI